jgi:hypothetical protein
VLLTRPTTSLQARLERKERNTKRLRERARPVWLALFVSLFWRQGEDADEPEEEEEDEDEEEGDEEASEKQQVRWHAKWKCQFQPLTHTHAQTQSVDVDAL